jgi:hypothetical protein
MPRARLETGSEYAGCQRLGIADAMFGDHGME